MHRFSPNFLGMFPQDLDLFFVSHSTARVILRRVVYRWGNQYILAPGIGKYQLSNMKCPGRDSNRQPPRLKASTLTSGYFGSTFATPPRLEIFGINALGGKLHQQGSPNLQDIFIGGKLLWD